jgi:accessory gene regulator protein AgrB
MKTFLIIISALLVTNVLLLTFSCNANSNDTEVGSNSSKERKYGLIIMILVLVAFNVVLHFFNNEPVNEENVIISNYSKNSISKSE